MFVQWNKFREQKVDGILFWYLLDRASSVKEKQTKVGEHGICWVRLVYVQEKSKQVGNSSCVLMHKEIILIN